MTDFNFTQFFLQKQFGGDKRRDFLQQLYYLVDVGVPASEALSHMIQNYKRERNAIFEAVATAMYNNTKQGRKIAEGMEKWFPYEICQVLVVSEERGLLVQGLKNSVEYFTTGQASFKQLWGAIPGFMYIVIVSFFIAFMGTKLLPRLGETVHSWPTITLSLINTGHFIYYYYYYVVIAIIALAIWINISLRFYDGHWYQLVALPFLSTFNLKISYILMKSLKMMTENGIALSEAIRILLAYRSTGYLFYNLRRMREKIRLGEQNMGEVLNTGIFSTEQISDMFIIAEHCTEKEYSKVFAVMADKAAYQLELRLKVLAKTLNIVFIVLAGIGIIWVYAAYASVITTIS